MRLGLDMQWRTTLLLMGVASLAGCQSASHPPARPSSILGDGSPMSKVTPSQVADVQIAIGRAAEKRGDVDQAMTAYQEALKRDSRRADAHLRLAGLKVRQGKFPEAEA